MRLEEGNRRFMVLMVSRLWRRGLTEVIPGRFHLKGEERVSERIRIQSTKGFPDIIDTLESLIGI